jgi:amino acid adenylation domain-containing protein
MGSVILNERESLVEQLWQTSLPVPAQIELQAEARPDATAVTDAACMLTFAGLERRSSAIGASLEAMGCGRETVAALLVPPSVDFVAAALGVLRAGAAYLPMDVSHPADRLELMLRDSGCPVVVALPETAALIPAGPWRVHVLGEEPAGRRVSAARPAPDDLAYVVYTSGSTGTPKGVEITHRNLSHLCAWHRDAFAVTAADRATQVASTSFDAAVWELWPHLTAGAGVWVADADTRRDPSRLQRWLLDNRITITFLPTALAELAMTQSWPRDAGLRLLLTGADTLHHHPSPHLPFTVVNNYGPSECTVVTTSGVVAASGPNGGLPSIGRPIAGASVYILDEAMKPVPQGVEGEIYIGGDGVGRGYRGHKELTAESFIADPVRPGRRLYRTGDLGTFRADGEIAFLGRRDGQVKIRGVRVELEEVAAALQRHPLLLTAAVTAWNRTEGDTQLAAYVVLRPGTAPTAGELRAFLEGLLPAQMLPGAFVPVERLPMTSSGKLDRGALPAPEDCAPALVLPHAGGDGRAPRTAVEERMTAVVAELLGLDRVGPEDNFFLLGGHSLLGTQIVSRVRDTYGVDLPLRSIFDHPTVAGMGAEIERLLVERVSAMSDDDVEDLLA